MRGDRPPHEARREIALRFTPHARGSTGHEEVYRIGEGVYPACAGIDPQPRQIPHHGSSLPRMRGDRPFQSLEVSAFLRFTPHARGSTIYMRRINFFGNVYPACAGIDLDADLFSGEPIRLPRMRGDRPPFSKEKVRRATFTPHARGSTSDTSRISSSSLVYPACAGIDLRLTR